MALERDYEDEEPIDPAAEFQDPDWAERLGLSGGNGSGSVEGIWRAENWSEFRDQAEDDLRWLARGLLPQGALVFISAPPKAGKTWLALALAIFLASGRDVLGEYEVSEPCPVVYAALEGARAGLRARIGALARGMGIDPDGDELDRLALLYRPRPFDLVDLQTAGWLEAEVERLGARFIVIDVLRRAARIKENQAEEFERVREALDPMLVAGRSVVLNHHFGKLSETNLQRLPGERMAGTGAMYGALDVGFFITKSESGGRRMRVEVEARDFATPDALGVVIQGTGSGEHGGLTYRDTATILIDETAAEGRDLVLELERLFEDREWRTATELSSKQKGIGAKREDIDAVLEATPDRFVRVRGEQAGRHVSARPWGTVAMLEGLVPASGQAGQDELFE